jgi:hypothetical protein
MTSLPFTTEDTEARFAEKRSTQRAILENTKPFLRFSSVSFVVKGRNAD